ncbi:MAG: 6-carboxytetrahydropterin synthase QueD [Waddliaceae bacterium]|jgi:6-pyruvoyltetrahydropterin/6-carboxytetrahydropterin synthase|nr:6-carboxytetrahydropterin synthase QueD [Waddliaceae bacterium]MBT3578588.1 6-carboxytetrahydropterin synthase QueD [Waddliaceae bacterium]MBT4445169.1 6-carboxytetrahydropterin synthase QueD [Waddliaceae bacterium]MBT6928847.1 6-carboxytetrahydropterin synthase QueD [Waddliaceae bacterium]MBT7265111.1 6-carboxytetrahydropterin synthase QueD [Waddliaceae bacterium]
MFIIEKTFYCEAGHSLENHDGKCRNPHGHSYTIKISLNSENLIAEGPKKNMVTDFGDINAIVKPMIEKYFDHKWLNDTLDTDAPTAEYMAQWIYNHLKPHIVTLNAVTVAETATAQATYFNDQ